MRRLCLSLLLVGSLLVGAISAQANPLSVAPNEGAGSVSVKASPSVDAPGIDITDAFVILTYGRT